MPDNKCLEPSEWDELERILRFMVADDRYITESSYSSNIALYPNHTISFVDRHIEYLHKHPTVDPHLYLANLKLMTRIG